MRKNIKLIFMLFKMKLSHMMVFRLNFFGSVFIDGSLFLIQLFMFSAIYSQVDSIGGWERGQMIIFVGTFSLINALNMVIFFFGINGIPNKIRNGDLDHYVTKPMNPLLRLTFESVDLGSLPLVPMSILVVIYGASLLDLRLSPLRVIGYVIMVCLMTLLWYDMSLILRTIPFFVISTAAIGELEGTLIEMNFQIPGILYKGVFKLLFWLVLPYGIMSTIPTQILSDNASIFTMLYGTGVVLLFTLFALWFWKTGLRHYKSASS